LRDTLQAENDWRENYRGKLSRDVYLHAGRRRRPCCVSRNGWIGKAEYEREESSHYAASPLEPASAGMGSRFAASHAAAVARENRQSSSTAGYRIRSGVLFVSRKCAGGGIAES